MGAFPDHLVFAVIAIACVETVPLSATPSTAADAQQLARGGVFRAEAGCGGGVHRLRAHSCTRAATNPRPGGVPGVRRGNRPGGTSARRRFGLGRARPWRRGSGPPGLRGMLVAALALGRCFGVLPEARGLVTHGPYRLVRHPLYLGELAAMGGLLVASPSPRNLALGAVSSPRSPPACGSRNEPSRRSSPSTASYAAGLRACSALARAAASAAGALGGAAADRAARRAWRPLSSTR